MNRIQQLPDYIVNQIKAGEVIERPSSMLKELLENAIDAGATKIDLTLIEAGIKFLKIEDNGQGISFSELPMAFMRHATSKIRTFDEIYSLHSFGFRGEALASIASISRISCKSEPEGESQGRILLEGGQIKQHIEVPPAGEHGTTIVIEDLFYNTPVRLKFLKNQNLERQAILRILNAFILSHPEIHFTYQFDDQKRQIFPKCSDPRDRFLRLTNKEEIITFAHEYNGIHLNVCFSKLPSPPAKRQQLIFVNNRLIYDTTLQQAIIQGSSNFWSEGLGNYLLQITLPPNSIDVNIHPQKTKIHFLDISTLFSMVKNGFLKHAPKIEQKPELDSSSSVPPVNSTAQSNLKSSCLRIDSIYLINYDEKIFALSLKAAISEALFAIKSEKIERGEEVTPLLIGEPFLNHSFTEEDILLLKSLGFTLSSINKSSALLTTVPDSFLSLPYRKMVPYLLTKNDLDLPILTDEEIHAYLEAFSLLHLENRKIIKALEYQTVERLFE